VVVHKHAAYLDKKEQERLAVMPKVSPRGSTPRGRSPVGSPSGSLSNSAASTPTHTPSPQKSRRPPSGHLGSPIKEVKVVNPLANPNKLGALARDPKFNIPRNTSMPMMKLDPTQQNPNDIKKQTGPSTSIIVSGDTTPVAGGQQPPSGGSPTESTPLQPKLGLPHDEVHLSSDKLNIFKSQSSRELKTGKPPPNALTPRGASPSASVIIPKAYSTDKLSEKEATKKEEPPPLPPTYFHGKDYLPLCDGEYSGEVQNQMRTSLVCLSLPPPSPLFCLALLI